MSRLRSKLFVPTIVALLALFATAAAAQNAYIGLYLTFNGQPYPGYFSTEYAFISVDGVQHCSGFCNVGWMQGSNHGLIALPGGGSDAWTVDTVETEDPTGGCALIAVNGPAVTLTAGDTSAVAMTLGYRWCGAGAVPSVADGASGLIVFNGVSSGVSFADTVHDGGYDIVHAGANAGQFPHGSAMTIRIIPLQGSSVTALGRSAGPGQSITIDTTMNTAVIVRPSFSFAPTFTITLGGGNPAGNDTVAKGTTKSPMIEFAMNPSTPQSLSSVSVSASGTGDESTDVTHVQLYLDKNANGKVDSGDSLLSSTSYSNGRTATLTVDPAFVFTGPTNFLVTYDFNVTIVQELFGGTAVLAMFPLFLLPVMRRRRRTMLLGIAMLTVSVAALSSCGGSDTSTGPPPAKGSSTYQAEVTSVTVSGTAHPTTLTGHTVTVLK